jgi:hypothetical protein
LFAAAHHERYLDVQIASRATSTNARSARWALQNAEK